MTSTSKRPSWTVEEIDASTDERPFGRHCFSGSLVEEGTDCDGYKYRIRMAVEVYAAVDGPTDTLWMGVWYDRFGVLSKRGEFQPESICRVKWYPWDEYERKHAEWELKYGLLAVEGDGRRIVSKSNSLGGLLKAPFHRVAWRKA